MFMDRKQLTIAVTSGVLTSSLTPEYLRDTSRNLMETAKTRLQAENFDMTPTIMIYLERVYCTLQSRFTNQAEKDAFYDLITTMAAEMNSVAIVSVADAL